MANSLSPPPSLNIATVTPSPPTPSATSKSSTQLQAPSTKKPASSSKQLQGTHDALLESDQELKMLYSELVLRTKTITEEEFWAGREKELAKMEDGL